MIMTYAELLHQENNNAEALKQTEVASKLARQIPRKPKQILVFADQDLSGYRGAGGRASTNSRQSSTPARMRAPTAGCVWLAITKPIAR